MCDSSKHVFFAYSHCEWENFLALVGLLVDKSRKIHQLEAHFGSLEFHWTAMEADESTPLTQYPPEGVEWHNRSLVLFKNQNVKKRSRAQLG